MELVGVLGGEDMMAEDQSELDPKLFLCNLRGVMMMMKGMMVYFII